MDNRALGRSLNYVLRAHELGTLRADHLERLEPVVQAALARREAADRSAVVRLTPALGLISDDGQISIFRGHYGVGGGPSDPSALGCPVCGNRWFNGARCVSCGNLYDD